MMASSTAVRLAALSARGHAPRSAANGLSTVSATSYMVPSIAASQNSFSQKRSHHHHASSSSTQFANAQWNGSYQMNLSMNNSRNDSFLNNSGRNDIRWVSSKSDEEKDQASSDDSQQAQSNIVEEATSDTTSGSSQHNTWVEFQKSIAVSGFETGQTVREQAFGKKSRGGKIDRKRKEREAELEAALRGTDNTQVSTS